NLWFVRVVFQRDAWDLMLEQWSDEAEDARVAIIVGMTQLSIWFSRLILRVLMHIGFFISGFMSRQMEYNADACQIKVVGTETFERTHRKLGTLEAAMGVADKQIKLTWDRTHQLPDNLPEVLRRAHESLPAPVLQ